MRHPRVSVVIPAFESEPRIGRTLRTLLAQTFSDFEAVIVNDGSTDATTRAVRLAMASDPRVRLIEQGNAGLAAARNRGIEAARGDLIAFLDDDDLWHRQKLELQVSRLDRMPDAAVVSCFSAVVDLEGRLLGWRLGGRPEGDVYQEMLEWDMVSGGSVAVVRRGPLEEAGGFDHSLAAREDWDLWIRLARRHPFTSVPRTLVGYTRRPGSLSQSAERMLAHGRAVLAKARAEDPAIGESAHRAFLARDRFGAACFGVVDGNARVAWRYLLSSVTDAPTTILSRLRRWGLLLMLVLATVLPEAAYRRFALSGMSRVAFNLKAGTPFDTVV
jgi:glycosyltransferase involved in cell wall biosynthesis